MNKHISRQYILAVINIFVSILVFINFFNLDKLTTILVILIITFPTLNDIFIYRKLSTTVGEMQKLYLNSIYKLFSNIFLISSILLLFISIYTKNILLISITCIVYIFANKFYEYAFVYYNNNYMIYRKMTIMLDKIQRINKFENKIQVIYFDRTTNQINLSSEKEVEVITKILRKSSRII